MADETPTVFRRYRLIQTGWFLYGMGLLPVAIAASAPTTETSFDNGSVTAKIQVLDNFQAEQEHLKKLIKDKPKAYQDKVMDSQPDNVEEMDGNPVAPEESPTGFRTYSVESRTGFAETSSTGQAKRSASETGVRTEYRFETPNHGEFVLQADARTRNSDDTNLNVEGIGTANKTQSTRATIRNLDLPLTPGVEADTAVGDINSEVTDTFSRSYHLSLGNSTVRGIGTHIKGDTFDLRAGMGKRAELVGGPYPGVEESQGSLAWAGYSKQIGDNVAAGIQINQAKAIPVLGNTGIPQNNGLEDVTSMATSLGYGQDLRADSDLKARAMLVQSHTSADLAWRKQDATGVFAEASVRKGRFRHELGAYTADPNLRFGDNALAANNRGAYWRVDHDSTRLNLGGGLDVEQYNPGQVTDSPASDRISLSTNAQYRIDREHNIGGNIHTSQTRYKDAGENASNNNGSRSSNASVFYDTKIRKLGRSRLSATLHRNETLVTNGAAATGDEIQWEQDWITGKYETMRPELSTTLGIAHDRSAGENQTYPTASVNARYWPNADLNIGGNLRYTSRSGNLSTSQGLSGTLSSEYEIGDGWHLGASASINEARVDLAANAFTDAQVIRSNDKSAHLYLRWEGTDGKPYQTIGNKTAGSKGSGNISGTVFFDNNRDGRQQADETNVPSVEVFLDGHYQTLTDPQGRFEFNQVATGSHTLTLNLDTIPLPWGADAEEKLNVDVPLRGQATAHIPVVKVGE
jgi:hypothetical protein